ncbi:MAG: type I-U CRISPR-associated helicase/endonuclease Cas3 [Acidobacteria bacterium]|nr:type I-U CRISPR-associated helicase/endonuclease Cas3 [Acidobacteriota bacterium]
MMSLTIDDYSAFYKEAHGPKDDSDFKPFPWQIRLARDVIEGDWPELLALPTSSGKTSLIDIAVFALALQADKPQAERTAPLRIFFIIDRRIVVDEAACHARELASKLDESLQQTDAPDSILRKVAQALCRYGGNHPLHVVALRGGMYRDESWTRTPNVPTVCLSTVDQIGSRLLFRGYGISEYARPIHAGLVGSDALLIVDEAHLSNPFLETVQEIVRYRTWAEQPMPLPWKVVQMSATPKPNLKPFELEEEDYQNKVLGKRLSANKQAKLVEAKAEEFECIVIEHAQKLSKSDRVEVVGIVVNRVASARKIFELLRQNNSADVILLTGRIRPFDRDRLLEKWLGRMRAGRQRKAEVSSKLFVVATQTVEVGANLDFDSLVTEAASLDALRQRFGRLDRLGELEQTQAVIVLRKEDGWKDDPVYGKAIADTWEWLKANNKKVGKQKLFDFGVNAFNDTRKERKGTFPVSELKPAPIMFPSHVDTWVQTSPTPHADPDPAPYLHGRDALDAADVQIVWRDDLNAIPIQQWVDIVALRPPVVREALPVPVWVARSWLLKGAAADVADVEGTRSESATSETEKTEEASRRPLRWCGPDESEPITANKITPGDTLVVPTGYGGADEYGWHPESQLLVNDIADSCANEIARQFAQASGFRAGRRPYRLRLDVGKFREGDDASSETDEGWSEFDENTVNELLTQYLANLDESTEDRFNAEAARRLLESKGRKIVRYPKNTRNAVVVSIRPKDSTAHPGQESLLSVSESSGDHTDTDDTASTIGVKVTLKAHCRGVGGWAKKFAEDCGLRQHLIEDLWLAGRLHDLGKADYRFQIWLHGGDALGEAAEPEPIAKSAMPANDRAARDYARARSGYPKGARHELLSVALVKNRSDVLAQAHDPELVLHLVGTHHGFARPFPPVVPDPQPVEVNVDLEGQRLTATSAHNLERLDSGWVEQFWRLVRRYGWWGLAYLEALLRLADYARSEEEQTKYGK